MPFKIIVSRTPGWNSPYGPRGTLVPLPLRMRLLAADALVALSPLAGRLIFTDVFRSPGSSLLARRQKRGVQRPGYSAHNFGLACDVDVRRTLKARGWDKQMLDVAMLQIGFCCYRADHKIDVSEAQHYTFAASGPGSAAVERAITLRYGHAFALSPHEVQTALAKLSLYRGALDGMLGPLSREAIMAFQRAWLLAPDGKAGPVTQRTLAVVTAEIEIRDATEASYRISIMARPRHPSRRETKHRL